MLLFAACLWAALANGPAVAGDVVVDLRAEVSVSRPLVLVRDIATLQGGTPAERNAIGALDLVLLNEATPDTHVSRRLIEVRMLVAGMEEDAAVFTGASTVHVAIQSVQPAAGSVEAPEAPAPLAITDGAIELELERVCGEFLAEDADNIDVHLSQPVAAASLRGLSAEGLTFQVVPGQSVMPGANTMAIQFWQNGELIKSTSIRFDVVLHRPVLVLNRFVPRGTPLTADMFDEQLRPVSEVGLLSSPRDVVGTEVLRDLPAGTVLRGNMVRVARQAAAPSTVKARDLVYVTYSKGGLNLSMADAVAMQDGQVGDQIRVMNPTSRNIFTAVVVGPGRVEVHPVR
jgi:flagella basal body P-ring formation protein FlgA